MCIDELEDWRNAQAMKRSKYNVRTPESGVLRACLDLLAAEKIWHRRWNTGAAKIGNRFFRFGKKGDADIILKIYSLCYSRYLTAWVETKSDRGKQTKEQRDFQIEVQSMADFYLIVRDVDTLKNWLIEHGVIRK